MTTECDNVTWTTWLYKLANVRQPEEYLTRARRTSLNHLVDNVNSAIVCLLFTLNTPPPVLMIHSSKQRLNAQEILSSSSTTILLSSSTAAGTANQESTSRPVKAIPGRD